MKHEYLVLIKNILIGVMGLLVITGPLMYYGLGPIQVGVVGFSMIFYLIFKTRLEWQQYNYIIQFRNNIMEKQRKYLVLLKHAETGEEVEHTVITHSKAAARTETWNEYNQEKWGILEIKKI